MEEKKNTMPLLAKRFQSWRFRLRNFDEFAVRPEGKLVCVLQPPG